MDKRTAVRAAGVGLGVAALATGAAHPALASGPAHPSYSTLASSAVFAAHPDHDVAADAQARIDALTAWANRLAAKIDAMPATTVVTGREREHLAFKLAFLTRVLAGIDKATSATSPLTAAQKSQLASVAATLATVKAKLATILANSPASAPTPATKPERTFAFPHLGTDPTRHHCDGTFDGSRWTWGSRDGSSTGDHRWWH